MTFEKYLKLSKDRFPENNYDVLLNLNMGWNRVDLIKKNAECLFIASEIDTEFSIETRRQLINLKQTGFVCFDN